MIKNIQSIRGMKDYLPKDTSVWQYIEHILKQVLSSYGYSEIRLPIIEKTALFKRAIGEITDVVEKEMYSFDDRHGNSLTLRPEGTAGCVRAGIEHSLFYNQEQRLWYTGPMFRYERPQKGRYRQFHQLAAEVFGLEGPDIDAEMILLTARCWKALGVNENVKLELNSLGSIEARTNYQNALVSFLEERINILDEDSRRRLYQNPLRILDSKNPEVQALLHHAPRLSDYLDIASKNHFLGLLKIIKEMGIQFTVNERLVRGLDYYNRTVFEWVTTNIGAKGTVCAGGRYDNLVAQLGGKTVPAIGFAIGLERLMLLAQDSSLTFATPAAVDVCIISFGERAQIAAMKLAEQIHNEFPKLKLITYYGGSSLKKQITRSDKLGARAAFIFGENEVSARQVIIKDLRTGKQETVFQHTATINLSKVLNLRDGTLNIQCQ